MVQANCRTRFTAPDFDFIVRVLSRSQREAVSLVSLLTDAETRDSVLDHAALADTILSQNGHLSISPQLYFYVLTRSVLRQAGIEDRALCDYLASLLAAKGTSPQPVWQYASDLLETLRAASPSQAFFLRAQIGDYMLFLTGMFPGNIERRRSRRGAPGCSFYEEMGRASYRAAASHEVARHRGLSGVFNDLAEQFHEVRLALNELAGRLLNLDDDSSHATQQGIALLS